jgi:hypothetical protein
MMGVEGKSNSASLTNLDAFSSIQSKGETELMRPAGVIALQPGDIFTMQPIQPDGWQGEDLEYAQHIAIGNHGSVLPFVNLLTARELNLEDLEDPVPASNYYDARAAECWGKQSHCGVLTDGHFRPQLSLAGKVWESLYTWEDKCAYPLVVDPPIRLEPIPDSKLHDLSLPVISVHAFPTTLADEEVPYRPGPSWSDEEVLQGLDGQISFAHRRPGLSPPTPLPTTPSPSFDNHQGGGFVMDPRHHGAPEEGSEAGYALDNSPNHEKPRISTPQLHSSGEGLHTAKSRIDRLKPQGSSERHSQNGPSKARDHTMPTESGDIDDDYLPPTTTSTSNIIGQNDKPSRSKKSDTTSLKKDITLGYSIYRVSAIYGLWIISQLFIA